MEKLLKVEEVAEVLQVSKKTAYGYMGQMIHMENPLRVSEGSLRAWINERTRAPEEKGRAGKAQTRSGSTRMPMEKDWHFPRR